MYDTDIARLTRERDEARERAASLSHELLTAIQARDSYRASAELRVGMRREIEEILGCGDTMGEEALEAGLARLRGLLAAESRAERLEEALRELASVTTDRDSWAEQADQRAIEAVEYLGRAEAAEARAERLEEALREIDARTGHFGEAPPPPEWMPMLSLIAWVRRTVRAALGEVKK